MVEAVACDNCAPHRRHISQCQVYVEIDHVEIECSCVDGQDMGLDLPALRRGDAQQHRNLDTLRKMTRTPHEPSAGWVRIRPKKK